MNVVIDTISHIKIGTPATFRNLTLFPLTDGEGRGADYLTLDEALAKKSAHVTEVSEGGSVPELKFINETGQSVFLLDGEELVGAKQNRVLNLSILVPAGKTLIIPVSCVERGRWHHRSREFSSAARAHYAEGRARKMSQVTYSMKSRGERHSDQGAVWRDLDDKFGRLAASSPTSAMSDIYEQHTAKLEDYVRSFTPAEGQVGMMFAIDGRIIGFDLFDCAETLQKLFPKLIRSYALDALDASLAKETEAKAPSAADAAGLLNRVIRAKLETFPAIGEGEDLRLSARGLTGAALAKKERVVHLSAFCLGEGAGRNSGTGREA
jgi:hypothetical protein